MIRSRLFGPGDRSPWVEASIYRLIAADIDPATGRLSTASLVLPDEEAFDDTQGSLRWAAGALDGVMARHGGGADGEDRESEIAAMIEAAAASGEPRDAAALCEALRDGGVVGVIDGVIGHLARRQVPIEPGLHRLALRLATETAERGPVKLGIALLGVARLAQHRDVVLALGRHEEFTLFSAVALGNMLDDAENDLWDLARSVDGWGRIQAVERLVPTANPGIRHWLWTEGFRNSILHEYLAHPAAVHGGLADALERAELEPAQAVAAAEILSALCRKGPAQSHDDYEDSARASLAFLAHARRHKSDLRVFLAVHALAEYVDADAREPAERLRRGWSEAARERFRAEARAIVAAPEWRTLTEARLREEADDAAVGEASDAAERLGIDTFDVQWRRLELGPLGEYRWQEVMRRLNAERVDRAVALALSTFDLAAIASGPADEMGFGAGFTPHRCLDHILQGLGGYPGKGWPIVRAALRSPVTRNRIGAARVLVQWGREAWPPEAMAVLAAAHAGEPHEELRRGLANVIATGTDEWIAPRAGAIGAGLPDI